MSKYHLKRLAVPQTWNIKRKTSKFVVRPYGYLKSAMPLAIILGEVFQVTKSRSETKKILQNGKVKLDGKVVRDDKLPAGLMSIVTVANLGDFRMLLNKRGSLQLKKLDSKESKIKPCKIISKTVLKGNKLQIGFHDGRTLLSNSKDYKLNDTVIFTLPDFTQKIHLKLEKNAKIYLTGGSNVGNLGTVENISNSITVKIGKNVVESSKENIFVVGNDFETIPLSD